ncbi:MAG: peptide-N-glycosidase F-related protein [Marinirhabdus sp.]|nr:peptide-N-glycosidase F-related protein [Marinirhabdus sp.]
MHKRLLTSISILILFMSLAKANAQTTIQVFDEVLFYDGYAALLDVNDLYEPIPAEVLRHSNSRYAVKLTDPQLDLIGNKLQMDITLGAACDNYDRIARAYLAFVDKGASTYVSNDVERLEIGRFITPFMNKNISPMEVDFSFTVDNIAEILSDASLRAAYDFWIELDVFGVPYAAQQQVAGCAGRIDTFYGTLSFTTDVDPGQTYPNANFVKTLACDENLNNYNATDVPGETTKIIEFELTETVEDLSLFIITSNHGANAGGEEYSRRDHFVYLDGDLIHEYIPGGKSCEPFRQFNTQGNGIYSASPRTTRFWLSFNNWCPGDVIPIRELNLGTVGAGQHTLTLDVPDAVFVDMQGYIPVSMYLQNRRSFQEICIDPTEITLGDETATTVDVSWIENGDATEWEIMYGRRNNFNDENFLGSSSLEATVPDLEENTIYSFYVRAVCGMDDTSNWVGPVDLRTLLSIDDNTFAGFTWYPNPTDAQINLSASNSIDIVRILNVLGQELNTYNLGTTTSTIDLRDLTTGVYFMEVTIAGTTKAYKFVKK